MEYSVRDAADRLRVDESRVRQLLRSGHLAGRRVGSIWLVDGAALAVAAARRPLPVRPLAPGRAWALLDLLGGGHAPWLPPTARSQVRAALRNLAGADAARWRAALRGRADVLRVAVHPAAVDRVRRESLVLPAGPQEAAARGLDLVVVGKVCEVYVPPAEWCGLAARYHAQHAASPNLIVHLPRGGFWPDASLPAAALAADCLETLEPRGEAAGLAALNDLAGHVAR